MLIEAEDQPLLLQFESVQELLTARRVAKAHNLNGHIMKKIVSITLTSLEDWVVREHLFIGQEVELIYTALRSRALETDPPITPHEDWERAHAKYMTDPYSATMTVILGSANTAMA